MENKYLTVSQLSKYISRKFDNDPYLETVYLKGEVSNAARNRAHTTMYFSLKDDQAVIPAVMFRNVVNKVQFKIEEGMSVFVTGRIQTYAKRGTYQIVIQDIQPDGIGALYQALEQSRKALAKEGLFNPEHKQPLPKFPKRIAVITSESGAVIRDIYTTIKRRYNIAQLVLYPTYVQGESAVPSLVKNLKRADQSQSFDTIIIGRGGGSIEDLWAFNDEELVRAIFEAKTPIISSVGHETDTTLVDLVADVRAATPTAAAELAVPVLSEWQEAVTERERLLTTYMKQLINRRQDQLSRPLNSFIFKQPQRLYETYIQNVDQLTDSLINQFKNKLNTQWQDYHLVTQRLTSNSPKSIIKDSESKIQTTYANLLQAMKSYQVDRENKANRLIESLDHLSPLQTLGRGYSYTSQGDRVIKSVDEVKPDQDIKVNLVDGALDARVTQIHRKEEADD